MLINIDKYKFHNLLEPIFVKTKDVLETMSDDYIFSTILNSNNDQNEEETWYYVQLKEGNVFYKSNNASRQMDDDVDINEKNKSADQKTFLHFIKLRGKLDQTQQVKFDTSIAKMMNRPWNRNRK